MKEEIIFVDNSRIMTYPTCFLMNVAVTKNDYDKNSNFIQFFLQYVKNCLLSLMHVYLFHLFNHQTLFVSLLFAFRLILEIYRFIKYRLIFFANVILSFKSCFNILYNASSVLHTKISFFRLIC